MAINNMNYGERIEELKARELVAIVWSGRSVYYFAKPEL